MAGLTSSNLPNVSGAIGTATGASHAETCNAQFGIITTESLTTAAAAVEERTLTNSFITANCILMVGLMGGTNTRYPIISYVKSVTAGSATIEFTNIGASLAVNGTLVYWFMVL